MFYFGATAPPVGQGLLIHEVSWSHSKTQHCRYDSSGRVISPSQRPLPNNTQHSQLTGIHVHGGIRTHNLSRRAVTGAGDGKCTALNYITRRKTSAERCPCLLTANRRRQPFLRWGPDGVREHGWGKKLQLSH